MTNQERAQKLWEYLNSVKPDRDSWIRLVAEFLRDRESAVRSLCIAALDLNTDKAPEAVPVLIAEIERAVPISPSDTENETEHKREFFGSFNAKGGLTIDVISVSSDSGAVTLGVGDARYALEKFDVSRLVYMLEKAYRA